MTDARSHAQAARGGRGALLLLLVAAGCTTPKAAPPREEPKTADVTPAPSASVALPASACASDADCRTWSSYCKEAPCVCRVLAKAEPEPVCGSAGNVACFADPCMKKAAACQDGRCVLVIAGAAGP